MAQLDEGSVGIKVLAGLPENNGLPAIAAEVLDDPRSVFALVEFRPTREVTNLDTDSHTVILRIVQVEPLDGDAGNALRDQLRAVREQRTGVVPLPGVDGAEVPAVALDTESDAATGEPLPVGPEWGDKPDAAADPTPTAAKDTAGDGAAGAPPFTPPTPITKPRKSTG